MLWHPAKLDAPPQLCSAIARHIARTTAYECLIVMVKANRKKDGRRRTQAYQASTITGGTPENICEFCRRSTRVIAAAPRKVLRAGRLPHHGGRGLVHSGGAECEVHCSLASGRRSSLDLHCLPFGPPPFHLRNGRGASILRFPVGRVRTRRRVESRVEMNRDRPPRCMGPAGASAINDEKALPRRAALTVGDRWGTAGA